MSIVRYVNKKTGAVAIYESTSNYDPVTKQSRPIRKYLGTEDPVTGELIPSSGKRGRKKASDKGDPKQSAAKRANKTSDIDYQLLYEQQKKECIQKDRQIRELNRKNSILCGDLERLRDMISNMLASNRANSEG